jgi:hypothetical protein
VYKTVAQREKVVATPGSYSSVADMPVAAAA